MRCRECEGQPGCLPDLTRCVPVQAAAQWIEGHHGHTTLQEVLAASGMTDRDWYNDGKAMVEAFIGRTIVYTNAGGRGAGMRTLDLL